MEMATKSVAIVTGASSGIGRATAIRLARDFSSIVLVAMDEDKLETAAAEVQSIGAEAMVLAFDLRQPQSVKTIIEEILDRFGRVDALLNIAGAVAQIDLFQMTDAQWDDGMALKFHGARRLTIAGMGRTEGLKWIRCVYVGKRGFRSKAAICGGCHDQRGYQRPCQGIRGARNQRRRAGQQRVAWGRDDRTPACVLRKVGACS